MENQIISINLVPNMSTPAVVRVSQYDVGRPLVFKVYDGTSPADLTGVTAVIEGTKKSGLGFSESGTVSDNTVTLDTTLAMTQEDGSIPAEIRFSKTGEDVGTANFILAVEPSPHLDGTTDGTTETMADLQSQLDALDDRVEALEGGGGGLTEAVKSAMLQIAQKVAYIDEHGQTYYDALYNALYPPAELVSISAVYTQSGTVYDTDTLDSLKPDLVVTAYYDNQTSAVVTNYTLSGTLAVGTSTITVSYAGFTDTFNVNVTASPTYVTDGLIHRWDAINNTRQGHDASVNVWEDLVGTNDMTVNNFSNISWLDDAVQFTGVSRTRFLGSEASPDAAGKTLEIVFSATTSQTSVLCSMFHNPSNANGAWGKIVLYSDGTYGVKGGSDKTYTGVAIADFHSISASYDSATSVNAVYANAVAATLGNNTHSLSTSSLNPSVGGSPNNYDYPFSGKIHAIRIYNRILTAEEVAQNYAVDVSRFNLG